MELMTKLKAEEAALQTSFQMSNNQRSLACAVVKATSHCATKCLAQGGTVDEIQARSTANLKGLHTAVDMGWLMGVAKANAKVRMANASTAFIQDS